MTGLGGQLPDKLDDPEPDLGDGRFNLAPAS
jgi:hypothetical protein